MKTTQLLKVLLCLLLAGPVATAQDRNPGTNTIYPDGAFSRFEADTTRIPVSGRVIDVTRPPFNATGDGVTDDTEAINAAYTFVAERLQELSWRSGNQASYIIYFPSGTYLVSNTIIHNLGQIFYPGLGQEDTEGVTWVRLVGQNRENTIIRLQDNSPGFEAGADKEVISFQQENVGNREGNNIPAANQLSNLTINVGSGNPGAIGASFISANTGQISNIKIISEDGQGTVGLSLPFFSVQGYFRDIIIEGFDYGIRALRGEMNPTFEYVTLRNQNVAGILANDGSVNIRRVESTNSVPFAMISQDEAQVLVLDSRLLGGDASTPAIEMQDTLSQLFVRNTEVSGYGVSVRKAGEDVVSGDIEQYVSDQVYTLFEGVTPKTLELPVADSPILDWVQDTAQWANVDAFPGTNDTERIQNAMNSGRPAVYFPRAQYTIEAPITIPATVRHVDFLYTRTNTSGEFIINESSSETLFLEHTNISRSVLTQNVPRSVVIRNASFGEYHYTSDQPSELFLEGSGSLGSEDDFCPPPLKIWSRSINNEPKDESNFKIFGGTMWTMGFKTEGERIAFEVREGGSLEVFGGLRNETTNSPEDPMVLNDNSNVSFIGYNFLSGGGNPIITDIQNGVEQQLLRSELPSRGASSIVVPLYVGTTNATAPSCLASTELVTTTTLSSATLSWNERNAAGSSYQVRYRALGTTEWITLTGINDTTTQVNGLAQGISYEWEVRANCGEDDFSEWSAPGLFTVGIGVKKANDSVTVDGILDEAAWELSVAANKAVNGTVNNDVTFGLLWDNTYLYVGARVLDDALFADSDRPFRDDAVEVYIDVNNNGGPYDSFDNQFIKGYNDTTLLISRSFEGTALHDWADIDGGYSVELAIPWASLGIVPGNEVTLGFDIGNDDDDDGGARDGQQVWAGNSFNFNNTSNFGDIILQDTLETASELRLNFTWDGVTADEVVGLESILDSSLVSFSEEAAIGSNSLEVMGDSLAADNAAIAIAGGSLLNSGFTTRSYSLWVRARDTESQQILFEEGGDAGGAGFQLENDSLLVLFRYGGGANFTTLKVPFADSDSTVDWNHLAVTYEAGIIGVYVNGEFAGSVVSPGSAIPPHGNPPSLGGIRNNQSPTNDDGFYLDGYLDEFKVFDGVLSLDEIIELADRPITAIAPPAVLSLYYPWDGTTADQVVGLESSLDSTIAIFSPETLFGTNSIEVLGGGNDSLPASSPAVAIENGSLLNSSFDYRSYSLWVRARNTTPKQILFEEGGTQGGAVIELENGNLTALFRYGGGSNIATAQVPFPDSDISTDWVHVGVTYAAGLITVYINGEEAGTAMSTVSTVPAHGNSPSLGGIENNQTATTGESVYFDGFLDEFRVFEGLLTPEEVADLADALADTAALAVYWPLEDTTGTTVENLAGPDKDGTIIGGTAADLTSDGVVGNGFDFAPASATEGPIVSLSDELISGFPFSTTVWVKPEGPQFSLMFTLNDSTSNRNFVGIGITNLTLADSSQGTQAFILADDGSTAKRANTEVNIRGEWHHLALVHESPTLRKLYVDGVLAATDTAAFEGFTFENQRLTLGSGRRGGFDGQRYRGGVDEFKLYRVAISEDSIEAMRVVPDAISLAQDSLEVSLDRTAQVPMVRFSPVFSQSGLVYASSDETVLAVDETGLISPVAAGEAYVMVSAQGDMSVSDSVLVTVVGQEILTGKYKLINKFSGLVMALDLNPLTNGFKLPWKAGANVHQWKDDDRRNKVWDIVPSEEEGYYQLVNQYSQKVLALDLNFLTNGFRKPQSAGANIYQWFATGGDNTLWSIEESEEEGYYVLVNKFSEKALALNPNFFTNGFKQPTEAGANIYQDNNNGSDYTLWMLEEVNEAMARSSEVALKESSTFLEEESEGALRIYPNPVVDVLQLEGVGSLDASVEVRILSLEGKQMLYRKLDQQQELDVSVLPAGVYILDVQQPGTQPFRTKIVKQ